MRAEATHHRVQVSTTTQGRVVEKGDGESVLVIPRWGWRGVSPPDAVEGKRSASGDNPESRKGMLPAVGRRGPGRRGTDVVLSFPAGHGTDAVKYNALKSLTQWVWHAPCILRVRHAASVRSSTRRPCPRAGACVARGPPDIGVGLVPASIPWRVDGSSCRPAFRVGGIFFSDGRLTRGRRCLDRRRSTTRRATPPTKGCPDRRLPRVWSRWLLHRPGLLGSTHPGFRSSP